MTKRNSSRKIKRQKNRARKHKIKMHGLSIDIPPELDLPAGAPFEGRTQSKSIQIPTDVKELFGPLIEVATNAWRLKIRMVDSETGEPKEEMQKLYRFVEAIFRGLGQAGIRIVDPAGKTYDSGMPLKVLNFEPVPGLQREEIIETVRPTILWKEQLLRAGEIIVGTPIREEADAQDSVGVGEQEKTNSSIPDETFVATKTSEESLNESNGDSGLSEDSVPSENRTEPNGVFESVSHEKENEQDSAINTEKLKQTENSENKGKE